MLTESNVRKSQSFLEDEELTYATQKKSNRGKAQSLLDDENQLRGTEDIKCRVGKVYH